MRKKKLLSLVLFFAAGVYTSMAQNFTVEAENGTRTMRNVAAVQSGWNAAIEETTNADDNAAQKLSFDGAARNRVSYTYTINAATAGTYDVTVYHSSMQDRYFTIQIGDNAVQVLHSANGSSNWGKCNGTVTFQTNLVAGENTMVLNGLFAYAGGDVAQPNNDDAPGIDKFVFTKAATEITLPAAFRTAEVNAQSGTGDFANETRSGTRYGGIGLDDSRYVSYTVNVTDAGVYVLEFVYLTGSDREITVKANNQPARVVQFPSNGSWNDASFGRQILVELQAGSNTISLTGNGNVSPIIDYFTLERADFAYTSLPTADYDNLNTEIATAQNLYDNRRNENGATDFAAAISAASAARDALNSNGASWRTALGVLQEAEATFASLQNKFFVSEGAVLEAETAVYAEGTGFGTATINDVTWLTMDNTARNYRTGFATYTLDVDEAGTYKLTAVHGCVTNDRYIGIQVGDGALQLGCTGELGNKTSTAWNTPNGEMYFYVNLQAGENTLKVRSTAQGILVTEADQQLNFADDAFSPVVDKFIFNKVSDAVAIPAAAFQHIEAEDAVPGRSANRGEAEFSGSKGIGMDGAEASFTISVTEGGLYLMDVVSYNGGWGTDRPISFTINHKPTFSLMENQGASMLRRAVIIELKAGRNTIKLQGGNPAPIIDFFEFTRVLAQGSILSVLPSSYEVTIGSAGFATFNADEKLVIPAGMTAYTGQVSADKLLLTAVEGSVLPADTPVVLEASAGTYTFIGTTDEAGDIDRGDLQGTTEAIDTPAGSLTLQVIEKPGFYTYTGAQIPANRAYLVLPAGVKALQIVFDDTDGITVAREEIIHAGAIYDLTGRLMQAPRGKGLYIINGKKVILK